MAKDMTKLKILLSEMEVRLCLVLSVLVVSLLVSHVTACLNLFQTVFWNMLFGGSFRCAERLSILVVISDPYQQF